MELARSRTDVATTLLVEVYASFRAARWRARSWNGTAASTTLQDEACASPSAAT